MTTPPRVLLVTPSDPDDGPGGRELLYRLNIALLGDLLGDRLTILRLRRRGSPGVRGLLHGWIDGVDAARLDAIDALIGEHGITHVFLDGSNLGAVARSARARRRGVRITTFFHNVEARFFLGALRARPRARALAVLAANWIAERAAVRASDTLVCLSERDGAGLRRLYGRGADAIAPMALADQHRPPAGDTPGRYLLFVGGGFYANLHGARWFAERVAPRLPLPTKLVGRGLEALAAPLAGNEAVEVVGAVESLGRWYADAALVVAPIFDGSGMKTKVAEALMHGKHVVGTPEAFSGYAPAVVAANAMCEDADAFVAAIGARVAAPPPPFDPAMRALYDTLYSVPAARARMAAILGVPAG